jgi:NADH:ubiquinone oxidoreductase subunit 6 (subunit J)
MGILYILVYVGAIAILFLFILSLLKIDYHPSDKLSYSLLGFLAIIFLPLDLFSNINGIAETISFTSNELYIIGNLFYTDYSILLIIIGIVLILSIIGAIGITK